MTSAVLDDIASLALVAMLVPIATGTTTPNLGDAATIGGKAIAFFAIVTMIGAWVFPHPNAGWTRHIPLLNRFGMRHVLAFDQSRHTTLIVLVCALAIGLLATSCSSVRSSRLGLPHATILVGLGMLGRAELAFVVLDITYVQNDMLPTTAFYTLMFTAFWLNVAVPISIRL